MCEYILYIVPGEVNSEQALSMIDDNIEDDVWVQDIRNLHTPLPRWLNGVPTLVRKSTKCVAKGTECIARLKELRNTVPASFGGFTSQLNHQSSILCSETGNSVGLSFQQVQFDNPTLTTIRNGGEGSVARNDVQEYFKLRDAQFSESVQSMKERSMEMVEIE